MRFLKVFKPELICSDDTSRTALTGLYFDGSQIMATNGRYAVRVPAVADDGDVPGTIPAHVFKSAVKWTPKSHDEVSLLTSAAQWRIGETQGDFFQDNTAVIPRSQQPEKPFPVEGFNEIFSLARGRAGTVTFGINAEMLHDLQKAFGSAGVSLEVVAGDASTVIRVMPLDGPLTDKCEGVIMPMRCVSAERTARVQRDEDDEPIESPADEEAQPMEDQPAAPAPGEVDFMAKFVPPAEDDISGDVGRAIQLIRETKRASTSSLQRGLRIGYVRSNRVMEELEKLGIVGPARGSEPREINAATLEAWRPAVTP